MRSRIPGLQCCAPKRSGDYLVVDDVGRIINPETLHGQVVGAAVQGLGSTFSEEIKYDENGQLLVASLADYMVPLATDFPTVRAISLEAYPSPNNPLGAKGAGEGSIIPVGGALTNAAAFVAWGRAARTSAHTPSAVATSYGREKAVTFD